MTNQQKLEAVSKQMKTIPKSGCLALIERLADKMSYPKEDVTLGSVIYLVAKKYRDEEFGYELLTNTHLYRHSSVPELCAIWYPCGLVKSLNEILEGAEVKEVEDFEPPDQRGKQKCKHCRDWKYNHGGRGCEVITSPVSDLFLFLNEIL